jgi:pyruvate dehydrogenase E1 component alpha subunit/2-oxoisovalerate dehydrogenase E1 component alpha subunit
MAYHMRLTRSLEERIVSLFRQSKVIGGIYRSLGQEGESVATASALDFTRGDIVSPLIRNMGSLIVAGAKPVEILRQYMARGNSPTRGRDLNIHIKDFSRGFMGPVSPLGAMIPVMAGVTMAGRMQGKEMVGMVHIGDGGSSTGAFAEGLNFAAVKKLPLVIVLENNGYAYSTPTSAQSAVLRYADRALGVGCHGVTVDGNDVLATHDAARTAVDRARAGEGVTLLEVVTFRMRGHAEHDNQSYVPKGLLEEWSAKDPIGRFERTLLESGSISIAEIDAIQQRIRNELDQAVEEAEASPMPDPGEAARGVYHGDGFWDEARQR